MADLLRLRAEASPAARAADDTAVIFVWLPGGPPHMETYDMKPEAPAEIRGDFSPIHTVVPGIDICEHLPLHAKVADRFSIIRSISHTFADHGGGHKRFLTGRDPLSPVGFVNDFPMVGSIVSKLRAHRSVGVPNYVSGTDGGREGIDVFSFGPAYLGPATIRFPSSAIRAAKASRCRTCRWRRNWPGGSTIASRSWKASTACAAMWTATAR